jgi:hypothetical protein
VNSNLVNAPIVEWCGNELTAYKQISNDLKIYSYLYLHIYIYIKYNIYYFKYVLFMNTTLCINKLVLPVTQIRVSKIIIEMYYYI